MTSRVRLLLLASLVLLALVAYAGMLENRFTNWDDEHLIVRNTTIRSIDPLRLLRCFHLSYPPLTVFTHSLDYRFWGLNPVGYHLTDLFLYALIVAAFFFLAEQLTGDGRAAFAAGTLFAVHPVHVESVAWLSSRKDGVAMLCYLAAFLAYRASERGASTDRGEGAHSHRDAGGGRGFLSLAALLYLGAVWAKPLMATLPLALLLYETALRGRPLRRACRRLAAFAVPLVLTLLAALCLDPHNEIRLPWHGGSPAATARAVLRVGGDYLRMLVFPVRLNALCLVRIPPRCIEIRCLLPLAAWALLAALAAKRRKTGRLFVFCLGWGVASLLPVLQFIPLNVIKADRYLYLPSAAFCLLSGAVWARAARRGMRGGWLAGLGAVAALFLVLTVARGTAWRDSVALWESSIAQDPANPDALNNLGIAYARERRYAEAEEALRRSLSLRPKSGSARNNLANVLILTGRHEEALRELEKAGNLEKDLVYAAQAHHTRGIAHEAMGDPARALEAYERALRLNPVYLDDAPLRARIRRCRAALSPAPRE